MHVKVQRKKKTHVEFMGYGISHSQLTLYSVQSQSLTGIYWFIYKRDTCL
jgi:hypothetical protein